MSLKKYFEITDKIKSLSGKTADQIGSQVESVAYHEQDIIEEERFIPRVDFSDPKNFARYGSAEEYYEQSVKRIYNEYPYDGSLREKLEWRNESTYIDLHVFDNLYPRTNGYIIHGLNWGTTRTMTDGYGDPADDEYIFVKGGPNANPNGMSPKSTQFTGSNYYEPSMNRASNLEFDLTTHGATLEFWMNKTEFITGSTEKEVIFDLWNGALSSSADYLRFRLELSGTTSGADPWLLTVISGTTGFQSTSVAASSITTASVADGNWHHYAVTVKSDTDNDVIETRFYVDGNLNRQQLLGKAVNDTDGSSHRAYIGALIAPPSSSTAVASAGKLSASLDELRYWKTQRSSEEIGRFWFTQVGGGVNTDPTPFTTTEESANIDLGVYFKFNEGITGTSSTDSTVLDYSGRFSNGSWTGYASGARQTGSAIVLSNAATKEFKDPIIYAFHPDVEFLSVGLQASGSAHDNENNAAIYNSIPSWIIEEDQEGTKNVKYLTQIISSYFDTLHLQIDSLNSLKNIEYPSGSNKPLPFAERLLNSYGFVAPEIFLDSDVLEKLADRSEDRVYEKSLHDIKNTIYQNIYNNLNYIYKTKGTEKGFRNLIRCFGIDDELVKLNLYADNIKYDLDNNRRNVIVADKFANFNTSDGQTAVIYNYKDTTNSNSVGFVTASADLQNGYASTLETEILLPLKLARDSRAFVDTNTISASLFGTHGTVYSGTDTTWDPEDRVNFQVYAVRDEINSTNAKFVLTGTAGGFVPSLESQLYQDIYNNTRWNLSVRIRPDQYPLTNLVHGTDNDYVVELHGVQAEAGEILQEFTVSGTVTAPPAGFITGSKRVYVGAHRTNFTGAVLQSSDIKVNSCRYWLDYINDEALEGHILDTENFGALQPHLYAYEFKMSGSNMDISKFDTLAFNWEFLTNTGSNASGQFIVDDLSSGSAELTTFGELGNILNKQYTARADFFKASSTDPIDKDFVVSSKLNLPENVQSQDMVRVLNAQEQDIFTTESRPINYFFAFEKSMYQTISEEMINYFATLRDLHNLIGDPVEKYRTDYKQMAYMRRKFFEKVGNDELDFDKFYEFYKWFDTSLSLMLGQLVPASADFADTVRTVVENHALERPKYQRKFPFFQRQGGEDLVGTVSASNVEAPRPPGTGIPSMEYLASSAATRRQIGTSNPTRLREYKFNHAPLSGANAHLPWQRYRQGTGSASDPRAGILAALNKTYVRMTGAPVNVNFGAAQTVGGVMRHSSNKPNFTFAAAAPYGPNVNQPSTNIPVNIMLSFDTDVEQLIDTPDVYLPNQKQRLGFGLNPSQNRSGSEDLKFDGNMYAPFSLYSSSVQTGYNAAVIESYNSGAMITNLHNDFVNSTDTGLQGPFTEKFVGGRFYRHTELNDGTDRRTNRPEGFRLLLGLGYPPTLEVPVGASGALGIVAPNYPFVDSPAGSAPDGFLPETPTAQRFRDETAKRPVNIKNILMSTGSTAVRLSGTIVHNQIGNYQKNYQVIQTAGRTINDPFFKDQSVTFAADPETTATRGRFPLGTATSSTANTGGDLDFTLPSRTGANSNETVFVNLFSSPGSFEVLSRGYLDPAHEELSVYNASPYRNRGIISHGMSGSASLDPDEANTIAVVDQIGKNRGLNQLATLHAGRFGSDAAYGSVPAASYVTVPSWHKTNRNRARRPELSGTHTLFTGSHFDNLFVQHAIPRSLQQYTWVTASLGQNQIIYSNNRPSFFSASSLDELTQTGSYSNVTFVGLNTRLIDPVSASAHVLGFPSNSNASSSYINADFFPGNPLDNEADLLNVLTTMRNGAFGYPTWKQIRTGETKTARALIRTNQIGYLPLPERLPSGPQRTQPAQGLQPNNFIDLTEAPISLNASPITFALEDNTANSDPANNMVVTVPFRNQIDYFSHNELNNFYNLKSDPNNLNSYNTILDFTLSSSLSVVVSYTENLYPADINMFDDRVRRRTGFTIDNAWNDDRTQRSLIGPRIARSGVSGFPGLINSQGVNVESASVFTLDARLFFTTELGTVPTISAGDKPVATGLGSGELLNHYSRYSVLPEVLPGTKHGSIKAAATYAALVPAGSSSADDPRVTQSPLVYAGDALWEAGDQSGKAPHQNYSSYADRIALAGKDHSIVPEFRISELIATYVDDQSGDFLAEIDNIFSLTGAALPDSSKENFYKTYTNADFLKYFSVIDEDLNDQRSAPLKIKRDKVSLRCNAITKFLPYKGFYPAERTVELATILSQSYGQYIEIAGVGGSTGREMVLRAFLEPLYAPGIMYNTIKSGLAVSNYVLVNTGSDATTVKNTLSPPICSGAISPLPEGAVQYREMLNPKDNNPDLGENNGYLVQKLPFETLQRPLAFMDTGRLSGSGAMFDTGVSTGSDALPNHALSYAGPGQPGPDFIKINNGKRLYELAIDNFLCETTNFFMDGLASFRSNREDQFGTVESGSTYRMRIDMFRTLDADLNVDRDSFDLYARESAFGYPLGQGGGPGTAQTASFNHVVPSYYHGRGTVDYTFVAPTTGRPTLDEILANTSIRFTTVYPYDVIDQCTMNIGDSINLTDFFTEVPENTVEQKKVWLVQSKFETPVLNFANVSYTAPTASFVGPDLSSSADIKINGMWHQYGTAPTADNEGIFMKIREGAEADGFKDLARVVGFETGKPVRIGQPKQANLLEEAVVAIPFKTVNNRRKFFPVQGGNGQLDNIAALMEKYIFPPRFDFVLNETVDPILLYGFEFSQAVSSKDITDMWQNLPPSIGESFQQKEVVIDDQQILDLLINNSENIEWLVFKVKKRGARSYNKFRRSLVTDDTSALPDEIGNYSYNWPYDYFSLVELVKMDETVQYASQDLLDPTDPTGTTPTTTRAATPPTTSRAPQGSDTATVAAPIAPAVTRAAPARAATATTTAPVTPAAPTTTTTAPVTAAPRTTRGRRGGGGSRGGGY